MGLNWRNARQREIAQLIKQQARDDAAYTRDLKRTQGHRVTLQCFKCAHIGTVFVREGSKLWRFKCSKCGASV